MALSASNLRKFEALGAKPYRAQAKWFVNSYWSSKFEGSAANREHLFAAYRTACALDGAPDGCALDQWKAHQFLEKCESPITWESFKKRFAALDKDSNNRLSLVEYLVARFDGEIGFLVNAPQKAVAGMAEAEAELSACEEAHAACEAQRAEAKRLHDEILRFKAGFDAITAKLEQRRDAATSVVKRGKAVAELNAHLSGARARRKKITALDPELLHTLEIKQGAALRKQKRFARAARQALKRAEEKVAALKASGTAGQGLMWWLERELEAAKKSMSQRDFARKKKKLASKRSKLAAASKPRRGSRTAVTA